MTEMLPGEYPRMARAETVMWWYIALHSKILRTIAAHFADRKALKVFDAGCGTGGLLARMQKDGYTDLRGIDIAPAAINECLARGLPCEWGSISDQSVWNSLTPVDVCISCDVLCYLRTFEEMVRFLKNVYEKLQPVGLLVMNLPALDAFAGRHDRAVGISKRFSKKELRELLGAAGFRSYELEYRLFFLSPLVFLARLVQRINDRLSKISGKTLEDQLESDVKVPSPWLNKLLLVITSGEDRFWPWKPFGSSLFVVAKKQA